MKELKPWEKDIGREIDPTASKEKVYSPKDEPEVYYAKLREKARTSGYSPKWADHRFHSVFGKWPSFDSGTMQHAKSQVKKGWAW